MTKRTPKLMYLEHHSKPLLSRAQFLQRVLKYSMAAIIFLTLSLSVGIIGYMVLAQLSFVDAFLNACMILGGMGPVDALKTDGAKIFAGIYALYSGIAFLTTFAMFILPFAHRFLHILHLKEGNF